VEKLTLKETIIFSLSAIFLFTACSSEKEQGPISREKDPHSLFEQVLKEKKKTPHGTPIIEDESYRKNQRAADACLHRYASCLEKCSNTACESACQETLSVCEKDLPLNFKTLKN
jgi:hypothetical protein